MLGLYQSKHICIKDRHNRNFIIFQDAFSETHPLNWSKRDLGSDQNISTWPKYFWLGQKIVLLFEPCPNFFGPVKNYFVSTDQALKTLLVFTDSSWRRDGVKNIIHKHIREKTRLVFGCLIIAFVILGKINFVIQI